MSEQWAITLATIMSTVMLAALGSIAASLSGLRKDLQAFVRREDCASDMGEHCAQIGALEKRLGKAENRLTAAEEKIKIFHERN